MTIGIGGWGARRKPMALVRAIAGAGLTGLTVVSFGGPDVGLLIAAGCVRRVVCGFVSLDTIALEPHFRQARQRGAIELTELDEGMMHWGLLAAAQRLPFLPMRAGLGSDVLRVNPELRTVRSPYADHEELVAVPALTLDVALVHMNRADSRGNGQYLGPDPYFDDLFCLAAERAYLSCERIVPTAALLETGPPQSLLHQPGHGARRHADPPGRPLHQLPTGLRPGRAFSRTLCRRRLRSCRLAVVQPALPRRRGGRLPGGRHRVRGRAAARQAAPDDVQPRGTQRVRGTPDPMADPPRRLPAAGRSRPWPSCASSPAPRPGAATGRSWPAPWG